MSVTVEVGVGVCDCPGRSWSFPAAASILATINGMEEFVHCHWDDSSGWNPCVVLQAEYESVERFAFEGEKAPTFFEWTAAAQAAADRENERPIEAWRSRFLQAVDIELAVARNQLVGLERRIERQRNRVLLSECRAVAARIGDPALSAAAHRLLAQDWAGTPVELLATAAAVLAP